MTWPEAFGEPPKVYRSVIGQSFGERRGGKEVEKHRRAEGIEEHREGSRGDRGT